MCLHHSLRALAHRSSMVLFCPMQLEGAVEQRAGYTAEEVIQLASAAKASRGLPSIAEGAATTDATGAALFLLAPFINLTFLDFAMQAHLLFLAASCAFLLGHLRVACWLELVPRWAMQGRSLVQRRACPPPWLHARGDPGAGSRGRPCAAAWRSSCRSRPQR